MNKEIIEKLRNSKSEDDNLLALEYLFVEFAKENNMGHHSKHAYAKRFKRFIGLKSNDLRLGHVGITMWFWRRYKEYIKHKQ